MIQIFIKSLTLLNNGFENCNGKWWNWNELCAIELDKVDTTESITVYPSDVEGFDYVTAGGTHLKAEWCNLVYKEESIEKAQQVFDNFWSKVGEFKYSKAEPNENLNIVLPDVSKKLGSISSCKDDAMDACQYTIGIDLAKGNDYSYIPTLAEEIITEGIAFLKEQLELNPSTKEHIEKELTRYEKALVELRNLSQVQR